MIFTALDYKVYDTSNIRLRLFFKQVTDVFNLKTNTMKKLSILTVIIAAIAVILLSVCIDGNAQSAKKVRKLINETNVNTVRWFNTGQLDSLMSAYWDDACLMGDGCGKAFIRDHFSTQMDIYKFESLRAVSISVADSIAVEKGRWIVSIYSGGNLSGEYLTEWRRRDKLWKIVNDISVPD